MTLKLTKTSHATSYTFHNVGDFGWAICTIDDDTGVLTIVSDWGDWAYRWDPNPRSLGAPRLTAFIARGGTDYVANKLQREGHASHRFSAEKTVTAWRKVLCARRLEEGREVGADAALSRECARALWDDLDNLAECDDADLFLDQAYQIEGLTDWITDTPYEDMETEQTPQDRVLREQILPALVSVLRTRAADQARSAP